MLINESLKVIILFSGKRNNKFLISSIIFEPKYSGIDFNILCCEIKKNEIKIKKNKSKN